MILKDDGDEATEIYGLSDFTHFKSALCRHKHPDILGPFQNRLSEQNLMNDDSDEPVKHPLIEEIFAGKKGSGYFRPSN